jgi:hypothetical protein
MALPIDSYNPWLRIKDRVRLVKLGGDRLEGMEGTLVGMSIAHVLIHWIVEFDEWQYHPDWDDWYKCVTIPSVCLEKVCLK